MERGRTAKVLNGKHQVGAIKRRPLDEEVEAELERIDAAEREINIVDARGREKQVVPRRADKLGAGVGGTRSLRVLAACPDYLPT